ncbi:protein OS-9 homolog isoform X1 [Amborella trichopoda]|uniref:protein OS-9 homolog isoform X1 n=1 Tax=Amborella trichopoda TaxID=13333 RepID=UPI0009BEF215|nr:protein OS-9 homolog isoform X1 [Amborella trichopoda]|eukprot:XP_011626391.2 protein OS-9 homolog isoform X1 [Amborella trichopoda]
MVLKDLHIEIIDRLHCRAIHPIQLSNSCLKFKADSLTKVGNLGKMRSLTTLFLVILVSLSYKSFADRILSAHPAGETFGRSSREPKYRMDYHSVESPFTPDYDQESVVMTNKNGQKFLCFLPKIEEKKDGKSNSQQNSSNVIMESGKLVKTPDELIDELKDQCFERHEGWWVYEFCYHKKLRQVHWEDNKIVQEFVMGTYDPEVTAAFNSNHSGVSTLKDPRSKDAAQRYWKAENLYDSRYHAHLYTNGTVCDLTNEPRETEVRFMCSESPRVSITSIKEISTCKYAVTIQCPMLCRHPMFREERPAWHTINCNEIPPRASDVREANENGGAVEPRHIIMSHDEPVPYNM